MAHGQAFLLIATFRMPPNFILQRIWSAKICVRKGFARDCGVKMNAV
jgi:hypothetical protein